jgi:hypothetical protein
LKSIDSQEKHYASELSIREISAVDAERCGHARWRVDGKSESSM